MTNNQEMKELEQKEGDLRGKLLEVGMCYKTAGGRKAFIASSEDECYKGVIDGFTNIQIWDCRGKCLTNDTIYYQPTGAPDVGVWDLISLWDIKADREGVYLQVEGEWCDYTAALQEQLTATQQALDSAMQALIELRILIINHCAYPPKLEARVIKAILDSEAALAAIKE